MQTLPVEEFFVALASPNRADLIVGGTVLGENDVVLLMRGDLRVFAVPLTNFQPSGNGTAPDFTALSFTDYGQTVCFGPYEAAAGAILREIE